MAPLSLLSVAVTEVMMKTNFVEVCYLAVIRWPGLWLSPLQ